LGAGLKQEQVGTPVFEVSGETLKEINTLAATQEIVDWAKNAPAEGARNLKGWLSEIDDDSLKSISAAQNQVFQDPEITAVVDTDTALPVTTMGEESGDVARLSLLGEMQEHR